MKDLVEIKVFLNNGDILDYNVSDREIGDIVETFNFYMHPGVPLNYYGLSICHDEIHYIEISKGCTIITISREKVIK